MGWGILVIVLFCFGILFRIKRTEEECKVEEISTLGMLKSIESKIDVFIEVQKGANPREIA